MYYFKNKERQRLIRMFTACMENYGLFYASMPTYEYSLYRNYKDVPKDEDGMVEVKRSGSITDSLFVNLPRDMDEMAYMFEPLKAVDILTVNEPLFSKEDMLEYHFIGEMGNCSKDERKRDEKCISSCSTPG